MKEAQTSTTKGVALADGYKMPTRDVAQQIFDGVMLSDGSLTRCKMSNGG